ncbi:sugar ABC transporter substrate-binding protein [Brucella pituitosa]|jgi:ribose transport system substrate-binding protein|uniref:sugar ABC transporter substrate-binding protein n=1 Tax=Brucella pituitosa TaxID=571256 RepID=UPI000C279E94|nr:sugar ABC transporter substrate-binding protein [Brucella pituitosa]PJO49755.1 sugar ABC transporter substrate-binding protein [Brucella pituitosa]PRA84322.1 sugar ABC transporter substrate-binding protein [Ochrobactrum sp. MYb29]
MKFWKRGLLTALSASVVLAFGALTAPAQDAGNAGPATYENALKGKRVVLVPMTMGFDLAQGWNHFIGEEVKAFGGIWETRDPNWSVDAGAQAITDLISSANKPDVLIVQSPDINSYSRLYKRAQDAGIFVIQLDNPSNFASDVFAGSDWKRLGELETEAVIKGCGPNSSKKIGVIQGDQVNASSLDQWAGVQAVLEKNPEFKIVGQPDSNWDPTTARNAATTLLQQNPDVCGIIDFWDATAQGTAAAIRDAGLKDKVFLVTTGGGEEIDCKLIEDGTFGAIVTSELVRQSHDVVTAIKLLLQGNEKPGDKARYLYTLERARTKADLAPGVCWSQKAIEAAKI